MAFLWTLSALRTDLLNTVFGLITKAGEETLAVVVICAIFWCWKKELAYLLGFTYFASGLLVQGLKITFRIERPWVLDPSFKAVESALPEATGYSFPSGHTQSATALFSTLGFEAKKVWQKILCFLAILLVGFSRMYLGVHTPADVLTAFCVTFAISGALYLLEKKVKMDRRTDRIVLIVLLAIAAGLLCYALALYAAGTIAAEYVTGCCKAAGAGFGFAVGFFLERRFINFDPRAAKPAMQLLKFVLGIAGVLALRAGLKALLGTSFAADTVRYFFVILWILALYPLFIKKFFSGSRRSAD